MILNVCLVLFVLKAASLLQLVILKYAIALFHQKAGSLLSHFVELKIVLPLFEQKAVSL